SSGRLVSETGKMNYRLRTAQTLDPRWRRCRLARITGIEIEPTFAPAPAGGVMAQRQQILQQRRADKAVGASNYAAHGRDEKREMTRSGPDFDRCADIDGLPDLFHVAIAQGNAAIGPIEFLGAKHCFFAPAILHSVNHDVVAGVDIVFVCALDIDGAGIRDPDG